MKKKVNEPLKTIFYLPHYASLLSKANCKIDHAHCSVLCLLKCIISLEKQHFPIFQHSNIPNETRGVNKNHFLSYTLPFSVKVSEFKTENWKLNKIDHAHCSKLCLVKCIILLEKQHFRIFQHSNIRNESRWVYKNHFSFHITWTSVTLSKVLESRHQLFKTVSPQACNFLGQFPFPRGNLPPNPNSNPNR